MKHAPSFIFKNMEAVSKKLVKNTENSIHDMKQRMFVATKLMYTTARTKRPDMGVIMQGKSRLAVRGMFRKSKRVKIVSDPEAKYGVPIRTGALRDSIKMEVTFVGLRKVQGRVWTESPYARRIEYGMPGTAQLPRPFIRPALDMNRQAYLDILAGKKST